jgi:hypothetical protein
MVIRLELGTEAIVAVNNSSFHKRNTLGLIPSIFNQLLLQKTSNLPTYLLLQSNQRPKKFLLFVLTLNSERPSVSLQDALFGLSVTFVVDFESRNICFSLSKGLSAHQHLGLPIFPFR